MDTRRKKVLKGIEPFFDIDELVCDHTLPKWGKKSWRFLNTDYLEVLLVVRRDILKRPMYCNGTNRHQRGLRCNRCQLVREKKTVYLSAHCLGMGGDFDVTGMTAEEARREIIDNQHLLPHPVRLEAGVSWLHMDVLPVESDDMVTLFTA